MSRGPVGNRAFQLTHLGFLLSFGEAPRDPYQPHLSPLGAVAGLSIKLATVGVHPAEAFMRERTWRW